ncbi:MAG: DUF115 domain-containing protein [Oceanospirillales bacterium]|nr:DUF115 domain-containing protein [Oceanospirillales bacterium]
MADLEYKLRQLRERWPEVAAQLNVESADARTVLGDTPETVLVYRGLHISSAFDPMREAELQAERVPLECACAWVYGLGSGYLADVLLARPQIKTLHVVFFNHQLMVESLATYPHRWLSDSRVRLYFAGAVTTPQWPFAAVYAELCLASHQALPLRDRVLVELNAEIRRRGLEKRYDENERPNLVANRRYVAEDPDVSICFGSVNGGCVTVVAGGPSVDQFLSNPVESDTLIVISTALAAVLVAGLVPDIVIALDGHREVCRHFLNADPFRDQLRRSLLIYSPGIQPEIVDAWPGKRAAFYLNNELFREIDGEMPRSTLFCSGTVTHCAVDLAVKMGASEVRLAGADFGFPSGFTHGEKMVHRQETMGDLQVMNGEGSLISSTPALVGYLRDLELYIEQHAGIRFIRMSSRGAMIAGTELYGAQER